MQTPWLFRMTPPWHLSYLDQAADDRRLSDLAAIDIDRIAMPRRDAGCRSSTTTRSARSSCCRRSAAAQRRRDGPTPTARRPSATTRRSRRASASWETSSRDRSARGSTASTFTALTPAQRHALDTFLWQQFPEQAPRRTGGRRRRTPSADRAVKDAPDALVHALRPLLPGRAGRSRLFQFRQFHFKNFYHPFVCDFAKLVYNPLKGIPGADEPRDAAEEHRASASSGPISRRTWVVEPGDRRVLSARKSSTSRPTAPTRPTTGSCSSTRRC